MPDRDDTPKRYKILVPTNFSHKSTQALEFALMYTHQVTGPSEVYLFHSYDDKKSDFRRLDQINEESVDRMRVHVLGAIDALRARGVEHQVDTVHRRLSYGKPWGEILKVAGGIAADMIIMGHPRQSGFRRLIEKAPCTLVLVKDKDPTFVMED